MNVSGRPESPHVLIQPNTSTDAQERLNLFPHPNLNEGLPYELIGECYLHGAMDGSGVDLQVERGIPVEKFSLC